MNFPLLRIAGTELRAHWTWVPILALIAVLFGLDLTSGGSDWPAPLAWAAAVSTALLVFLSVAAHELAHVAIARRNGLQTAVVSVQLMGGPFVMEVRPATPGVELRIALAGPLFSLAVMAVLGGLGLVLDTAAGDITRAPSGLQAIQFVAVMVAVFNCFLGLVNLVPGYPMDGARVVHAVAWLRSGREDTADATAIRIGRWIGLLLMVVGATTMLLTDVLVGLGFVIAGWLLVGSSRLLDRRSLLRSLVTGVRAGEAADDDQSRVPPQLTLDVFAGDYLGERLGTAALVERGAELLGMIGTAQIRRIPRREWTRTRTEQAMVPLAGIPRISVDAALWTAMEALERTGLDALLLDLADGGRAVLTRRSMARLVQAKVQERQGIDAAFGRPGRGRFLGR